MSTVINRTTKEISFSAHTPDFDPADWVIYTREDAAKISALIAILETTTSKYLTFDGSDNPVIVSDAERDAIDAADAAAAAAAVKAQSKQEFGSAIELRATVAVLNERLNVLETIGSVKPTTLKETQDAIISKIDVTDAAVAASADPAVLATP